MNVKIIVLGALGAIALVCLTVVACFYIVVQDNDKQREQFLVRVPTK